MTVRSCDDIDVLHEIERLRSAIKWWTDIVRIIGRFKSSHTDNMAYKFPLRGPSTSGSIGQRHWPPYANLRGCS